MIREWYANHKKGCEQKAKANEEEVRHSVTASQQIIRGAVVMMFIPFAIFLSCSTSSPTPVFKKSFR